MPVPIVGSEDRKEVMQVQTSPSSQQWKTTRAAIQGGWGPTLRLTVINTLPRVVTLMCLWLMI